MEAPTNPALERAAAVSRGRVPHLGVHRDAPCPLHAAQGAKSLQVNSLTVFFWLC
jgi:hypothetical protein